MPARVKIDWLLDIVDRGGPADLLKQDRALRKSIGDTDASYSTMGRTASSTAGKQVEAARTVGAAQAKQADATGRLNAETVRYTRSQQESLSLGTRARGVNDELTAALDRQAGAIRRLIGEELKLHENRKRHAAAPARAATAVGSGIAAAGSAVASTAKTGSLLIGGAYALGGDLAFKGLERGARLRAGAAGLSGLTGLNPRQAEALALIAEVENVSARGLGTSFATLGKQATGYLGSKPSKATTEGFAALNISQGQVAGLKNNLPGLFDLVYGRAQKLPATERAAILKTFLGRGAALGGQIELAGPLTKQLKDVSGQLGDVSPKHLQDLHETEIKLKEATGALELQFAATFGPTLIKLFQAITPAIKPVGEALHTAIAVPLKLAKELIPPVFDGLKAGITGEGPHIANAAGPGHTRRLVAGAGERPHAKETELEKIGGTIGSTLRDAGKETAKYATELLAALKPAEPFFNNILLPAVEAFGKGIAAAFKIALPIIGAAAKALGALGEAAGPLGPEIKVLGIGLGILLAGSVLGKLGEIPKIGFAFKAMAAPIKIAGGALGGFGRVVGGIGGALTKTGGLFDKFPGRIGRVGGAVFKAAGGLTSAVGRGLSNIGDVVGGKGAEAGDRLGKSLRGGASKMVSAAKALVGAFLGPLGGIGKGAEERIGESLAASSLKDSMKAVGLTLGRLVGAGIIAAIGYEIYAHRQEIAEKLKEIVNPGSHSKNGEGINSAKGKAKPGSGFEEGVQKILGLAGIGRRGGRLTAEGFRRYATGGMVEAMVSPGEQILYGGSSFTVPGTRIAADTVRTSLPVGAAVLTYDGQAMMAAGASLGQAVAQQRPHFAAGGVVVGKVSTFGPPSEAASTTASGASSSKPGVAIRPGATWQTGKPYLGSWWQIGIHGHTGKLQQIDLGPNQSTGRRIDVTGAGARQLGFNPAAFPTDAIGTAVPLKGQGATSAAVPVTLGRTHREGLIGDALQKGIEAGAAGEPDTGFFSEVAQAVGTLTNKISIAAPATNTKGAFGGLTVGRVDQGLDFSGAGPVRALGSGKVLRSTIWPGWPGTGGVVYRAGGRNFYVMEDFAASVKTGQAIKGGQIIGRALGGGSGIEAGLANTAGTGPLTPYNGKPDGTPMPGGIAFKKLVGYQGGGIVGHYRGGSGGVGRHSAIDLGLGALSTSAGGAYAAAEARLYTTIGALAVQQLERIRASLVRGASAAGTAGVVKSYQALISLIDHQIGERIGSLYRSITLRKSGQEGNTGALERLMQARGIDPSSGGGLALITRSDQQNTAVLHGNVARAESALRTAKRTGNTKVIGEASEKLVEAQTELSSAVAKGLEDQRNLIRARAAEATEASQFGVTTVQNALSGLEASQRLNRTSETVGGEREKASTILGSLIPALQGQYLAEGIQRDTLGNTGASDSEVRAVIGNIQTTANEIASALADAAELMRQAAEQAAKEVTESTEHAGRLADLGLQRLEIEERINGTFEGSGQERASYIHSQIVPALEAELAALRKEQQVANEEGDPKLASQIAEAIYAKENDVKQATLSGIEAINANTSRKPGGTLGFADNGETVTDALVGVGFGA